MNTCIVDQRIPKLCEERLSALGYTPIKLPPIGGLSSAVASHTDIILFHHKNTIITSKKYFAENKNTADAICAALPSHNIILSDIQPSGVYPYDAVFNALVIGKNLFTKADTVCPEILSYAESEGLNIVSTRQGYPACTALPVGELAAITSDRGMARLMSESGLDVLTVEEDEAILLPPYKNGFIGGAAGTFENEIFFLGNFGALKECDRISAFIEKHGFHAVSADPTSSFLCDLGGILFC